MAELRIRVVGSYGNTDIVANFDGQTTIGQLADELEKATDRRGDRPRTIKRRNRGERDFARDRRIAQTDLRSGDEVSLAIDSGVRTEADAAVVAVLHVEEGPDAGRTFDLSRGESTIGRSSKCDLVLNDDMASRRHAIFRVSDIVEVADAGSTNGVHVDGELLAGVRRLRPRERVSIGDTVVTLKTVGAQNETITITENTVEFNRPPRIDKPFGPIQISLPRPVEQPRPARIPLISALAPLVMGLVLYLVTQNILTVLFIGLSPIMLLGNFIETKRSSAKDHAAALAEYEATLHDQRLALGEARADEIRSAHRFNPGNDELLEAVSELSSRLWERELEHQDFLALRVGLHAQPSQIAVEIPSGGKRDQRIELQEIVDEYRSLPPVPISFDARAKSPVGIAGQATQSSGLLRALVLQAATLHSPDELVIGALLSEGAAPSYEWMKWLPHTRNIASGVLSSSIAVGADSGIEWLVAIQQLVNDRLEKRHGGTTEQPSFHPHLLLVIDGNITIERSRMSSLLEKGREAGVSVIWAIDDARRVPNACRTVLTIEPGGETVTLGDSVIGDRVGGIPLEPMPVEEAETLARALAPIVDISADRVGDRDLPQAVNLLDLIDGLALLESPSALAQRWESAKEQPALRASVGAYDGGTLNIDIRVDGPHGLVGGTTGAGKSEFLQSYLAGLALNHGPDRINFLLVDYKGGAAFGDLVDQVDDQNRLVSQGLRHTVGMITDLTPALVQRALISLQAEVHRREVFLNRHRAKDLMELERDEVEGRPANLLIVVDEFAALAKEVPSFVDGIVDIAQRGRSLGLHLLLATQKPGGVVTPHIQANTNLRVALRMATEDESQDVVRSPVAGRIDRRYPGRGVIRRGPTDLVAFQSAYVGGVTTPATAATLRLGEFMLGKDVWINEEPKDRKRSSAQTDNDLKRIVRAVNASADALQLPPPARPWLDPLPSLVNLLDLPRPATDASLPFGLADVPQEQDRDVAFFHPDRDGSLLMFGMGGSGKTVAIRSLITAMGLCRDQSVIHVHCLDFAGRGLEMLAPYPHVGSIIASHEQELAIRLLLDTEAEIQRRSNLFASVPASTLAEYRNARDGTLPRLVIVIDGFDNFQASFERIDGGTWLERLPRMVADGRQVGIHFVLTGTRRSSFPIALMSHVSSRLIFRMASDDDYHAVGISPDQFDDDSPSGRCRFGGIEVQCGIVGTTGATIAEANAIEAIARDLRTFAAPAPKVRVLPETGYQTEHLCSDDRRGWLLTEAFDALLPESEKALLIAGPPSSGKSIGLQSLAAAFDARDIQYSIYTASPSPLFPNAGSFDELAVAIKETDEERWLLIDDADRLAGNAADQSLQAAITEGSVRVVLAADVGAARGFDALFKLVRERADVCVLQPNPDRDSELLGAHIPRSSRRFPPGRVLARFGKTVHYGHVLING